MSEDVRTLPLWRSWLEANEGRIAYGATFTSKELVEYLGVPEDSVQFNLAAHEIRRALRRRGMVFTAKGQHGHGYVIAPPNANADEVARMGESAVRQIAEAVILGEATPLGMLTPEQRRIHEARLEKQQTRLALLARKAPGALNHVDAGQRGGGS